MRSIVLLFLLLAYTPSHALGPLDGEATISWWNNELSGNAYDETLDAGTYKLRAEGWWDKKWGVRGELNLSDIEDDQFEDRRRYNLDLKRRLLSPTDNTFLAAGLGWENLRLESGENSQGIRLSLEGRVGLIGVASLYGESIWLPSLDDTNEFSDLSGVEFETGVVFNPLPFISIRAGYRQFKLDYSLAGGRNIDSTSKGFLIGAGIHW